MFVLYPFSEQKTSTWSGGTTTELAIFPKNALYLERNFDFRISTATVDVEKSDFTSLVGFSRFLMILDGEMELIHETFEDSNEVNQYTKKLKQFDFDFFDGSWKTESIGKVRDFNVIYRPDLKVDVDLKSLSKIAIQKTCKFHFLFLLEDCSSDKISLKQYDLIEVEEGFESDFLDKVSFLEIRID